MQTRRSFLRRIVAAPAAAVVALHITRIACCHCSVNVPPPPPAPEPDPCAGLFNPTVDLAKQYRESTSIRFVQQWNVDTDKHPMRIDVLYGVATIRPEFAVRLADA